MNSRPRAFCEFPAGLAAVSLRLHGGEHCRPPISRQGAKTGYAHVILAALGLRSGQGAWAYCWGESDPDVRALLRAYPDPDMLRRIADIIRGWKDEEPRALWERLRAERKARGPAVEPADVGGWMFDVANAHGGTGGWKVVPSTRPNTDANMSAEGLGDACHRLAEYAIAGQWAYRRGVPESGFNAGLLEDREPTETGGNGAKARTCEQEAGLWSPAAGASRWPPVAVLATIPDAATLSALLGTPGNLDGVVVYSDPDYRGTTGYAATCRDLIPDLARGWDAAGAVVCVSEAVPVPELTAQGWHSVDITGGRKGQRRTFARVATEALTMNREPQHRVAVQVGLGLTGAA